jgi:methyl-accepting chemotaxis protein WspA
VQGIINNAMSNPIIYAVALIETNGNDLVYGIKRDSDWRRAQIDKVEEINDEDRLNRKVEVKHQGENLGYLQVYFTKRFMNERLRSYLLQTLVEIILLIAILTFTNILLLRKLLIHPIKSLQQFAEEIKTGNLRAEIERATFIGELASLRTSLKEMAAEILYSLIRQIQKSVIQVKTSATEIFASARELEGTVSQQAASTRQVGVTSGQIANRSRQLAETMNEVVSVARETVELAGEGQGSLKRMESTLHVLIDATRAISSKLSTIDSKAENISSIVVTINKVSEQTNLLSLNAAIEAEKAGEYGRGFSVVAREIRRLSDQTETATLKIAKMVEAMQSAVSSGVMEMDKFMMRVNQSVAEMGEISKSLVGIIDQVRTLFPRYEEVNEAMQAQSSGAGEISSAMDQLSEIAEHTRESLQEFNRAALHLTDAVESLQAEVSRFKVNNQSI